jgi:hypothetical protein
MVALLTPIDVTIDSCRFWSRSEEIKSAGLASIAALANRSLTLCEKICEKFDAAPKGSARVRIVFIDENGSLGLLV